ncbi:MULTISPECIES: cupin domain-containing protein [Tropicimonas]|uniref:Cupin domain-containing protein n=2 Tax=Tropicimonas TaxID=599652 RepID=A0A239D5B3_9RHOB|nr:cupin domain-containing protein [Tropicimonas sediminicola]SNS27605.1 Cupin domain-containing protein [Tropicimonas sediminicola]
MDVTNFCYGKDHELEDLGGGIKRRMAIFADNAMVVEVHFEKGAVAALHSHPHEQISYVLSGVFEFEIGDQKKVVRAGDSTYKQPNMVHGATCLEEGVLLDFFTPHREDFVK